MELHISKYERQTLKFDSDFGGESDFPINQLVYAALSLPHIKTRYLFHYASS